MDIVTFDKTDEKVKLDDISPQPPKGFDREDAEKEFVELGKAPGAAEVVERYHRLAHDLAGRPLAG